MLGTIVSIGTHFHLSVGDDSLSILEEKRVLRTNPEETMEKIVDFFKNFPVEAFGIGSFGPIDIDPESDHYGHITSTPKFGWEFYDFVGELKKHFHLPMAWTTNANVSALGEYFIHSSENIQSLLYLTLGTGVGGGFIYKGEIFQGISHPEMGHILIERLAEDSSPSHCPYHENCLEGRVSRAAIQERKNINFEEISSEDPIFLQIADYIAQALVDITLVLRPDRIVLGGPLMETDMLLAKIKKAFEKYFNSYIPIPALDHYIKPWDPKEKPGTIGAYLVALKALDPDFKI